MSHKHGKFLIHRQQLRRLIWLISYSISLTSARVFFARDFALQVGNHNPATRFPHSRPNRDHHWMQDTRITGVGMTERQERLAKEREEIAMRVANFKATQEKFEREREEYFVTTLENARSGSGRPFWS